MSNEDLLKPRYKVVAPWPGSRFEVGEILYKYFFETSKTGMYTYVTNTESPLQGHSAKKEDVEAMPHLFKKLEWWEDRKPEELLTTDQEWRNITGHEGAYQVSNLGLIKSLQRSVHRKHKGVTAYNANRRERLIAFSKRKDGYLKVDLSKDDIASTLYVHLLVADAFLPIIPGKDYINHIDNNRSNPMLINLERCTQSENILHSIKTNDYCGKMKNRKKPSVEPKRNKAGMFITEAEYNAYLQTLTS